MDQASLRDAVLLLCVLPGVETPGYFQWSLRDRFSTTSHRYSCYCGARHSISWRGLACYSAGFAMGSLFFFSFSWWAILVRIVAIVHFIRRRPDFFWIWVILIHPLGALVYIAVEVLPDAGLLRGSFQAFPRRRRIHELERAILDNPSAGNYEELGLLYLDDGDFARARACYDRSIAQRSDSADPFYRRGVAEVELGDFAAAVPDLERAVGADPTYDFHRGIGLLAHAYGETGQPEKAAKLFEQATRISTS